MNYQNPDPMDFPNVHVEPPEVIQPTRPISPYRRGVSKRRRGRQNNGNKKEREDAKVVLSNNMDVDIDVSLEIYDDHEHKHTICTEHHKIDFKV